MGDAVQAGSGLVADGGLLALLTTSVEEVAIKGWTGADFSWGQGCLSRVRQIELYCWAVEDLFHVEHFRSVRSCYLWLSA